jgi:hypothetical protein
MYEKRKAIISQILPEFTAEWLEDLQIYQVYGQCTLTTRKELKVQEQEWCLYHPMETN